jgi:hypothetical protein
MLWQPDFAACISLARRTDRRAALADLDRRLGFQCHVIDAIDGEGLTPPPGWSAYACMLSHRRLLERVPAGATLLVLEDDAVVQPNFHTAISRVISELPAFWESIYIGGEHVRTPSRYGALTVRCVQPIRTLGYIVRGGAVGAALEVSKSASNHWDLMLGRALVARNTCFAASPFLVTPNDLSGDIPDSEPYRAQ